MSDTLGQTKGPFFDSNGNKVDSYPSWQVYERLYAKYLEKGCDHLIDIALTEAFVTQPNIVLANFKALDLCAGGCRLSKRLLNRGCGYVLAIEKCSQMVNWSGFPRSETPKYGVITEEIPLAFGMCYDKKFDLAFCQQAVNNWFSESSIRLLSKRMNEQGVFVFNTFANKPSTVPNVRQYKIGETDYVEVSYLLGDNVHHVQICDGEEPHLTSFRWISEDEYLSILSPYFKVGIIREGNTVIYRCVKQ